MLISIISIFSISNGIDDAYLEIENLFTSLVPPFDHIAVRALARDI